MRMVLLWLSTDGSASMHSIIEFIFIIESISAISAMLLIMLFIMMPLCCRTPAVLTDGCQPLHGAVCGQEWCALSLARGASCV